MLNRHGTRLDIGTAEDLRDLELAEAKGKCGWATAFDPSRDILSPMHRPRGDRSTCGRNDEAESHTNSSSHYDNEEQPQQQNMRCDNDAPSTRNNYDNSNNSINSKSSNASVIHDSAAPSSSFDATRTRSHPSRDGSHYVDRHDSRRMAWTATPAAAVEQPSVPRQYTPPSAIVPAVAVRLPEDNHPPRRLHYGSTEDSRIDAEQVACNHAGERNAYSGAIAHGRRARRVNSHTRNSSKTNTPRRDDPYSHPRHHNSNSRNSSTSSSDGRDDNDDVDEDDGSYSHEGNSLNGLQPPTRRGVIQDIVSYTTPQPHSRRQHSLVLSVDSLSPSQPRTALSSSSCTVTPAAAMHAAHLHTNPTHAATSQSRSAHAGGLLSLGGDRAATASANTTTMSAGSGVRVASFYASMGAASAMSSTSRAEMTTPAQHHRASAVYPFSPTARYVPSSHLQQQQQQQLLQQQQQSYSQQAVQQYYINAAMPTYSEPSHGGSTVPTRWGDVWRGPGSSRQRGSSSATSSLSPSAAQRRQGSTG